jgi:hypothetical protein
VTSVDLDRFARTLGRIAGNLDALHVAWKTLYDHASKDDGSGITGAGPGSEMQRTMLGLWTLLCDYDQSTCAALETILLEWDEVMEPSLEQLLRARLPSRSVDRHGIKRPSAA